MEPIERPNDTELAREIGVSRGTFSSVQAGKRKLSKKTQERWNAVTSRYARAEEQHEADQRKTEALAEMGKHLVALVGGKT